MPYDPNELPPFPTTPQMPSLPQPMAGGTPPIPAPAQSKIVQLLTNPNFLQMVAQGLALGFGGKNAGYMAQGIGQSLGQQREFKLAQTEAEARRRMAEAQIGQGRQRIDLERQRNEVEAKRYGIADEAKKAQEYQDRLQQAQTQANQILMRATAAGADPATAAQMLRNLGDSLDLTKRDTANLVRLGTSQLSLKAPALPSIYVGPKGEMIPEEAYKQQFGGISQPDWTRYVPEQSEIAKMEAGRRTPAKPPQPIAGRDIPLPPDVEAQRIKMATTQASTGQAAETAEERNFQLLTAKFMSAYGLDKKAAEKAVLERLHPDKTLTANIMSYEDALRIATSNVNLAVSSGVLPPVKDPAELQRLIFQYADSIMEKNRMMQPQTPPGSAPKDIKTLLKEAKIGATVVDPNDPKTRYRKISETQAEKVISSGASGSW